MTGRGSSAKVSTMLLPTTAASVCVCVCVCSVGMSVCRCVRVCVHTF